MDPVSFRSSAVQGFLVLPTCVCVWVAAFYPMRNRCVYSIRFMDHHPFVGCEMTVVHGFFIHFYPMVFLVIYVCVKVERNQ